MAGLPLKITNRQQARRDQQRGEGPGGQEVLRASPAWEVGSSFF